MWEVGSAVQRGRTGIAERVPACPKGVYIRVKRSRGEASGSSGDDAPPLLKVRLDNNTPADSCVRAMLGGTLMVPSASDVLRQEEDHALRFRLLTRSGQAATPRHKLQSTQNMFMPSSTPILSVEHVWDLQSCVVMDCMTLKQGQKDHGMAVDDAAAGAAAGAAGGGASIGSRKCVSTTTTPGTGGMWSLYVLDNNMTPALSSEEEEEDEFDFDKLHITRSEGGGGGGDDDENNAVASSAGGGGAPSFPGILNFPRAWRKRPRDDAAPEFILSSGLQNGGDIGNCNGDTEGAIVLCEMLREYGQDVFLLENEAGCEPELYMYPDHRKDDEYDSNAADFSGNEYPEEPSSSSGSRSDSSANMVVDYSEDDDVYSCIMRSGAKKTMEEASLGSSWGSFDEDRY